MRVLAAEKREREREAKTKQNKTNKCQERTQKRRKFAQKSEWIGRQRRTSRPAQHALHTRVSLLLFASRDAEGQKRRSGREEGGGLFVREGGQSGRGRKRDGVVKEVRGGEARVGRLVHGRVGPVAKTGAE